jgi:nucleotide-binding universal stress UspA family protein
VVTGIFIGVNNTVTTQAVMTVSPVDRSVASAAYGFVRFIGGGLAPLVAGILVEKYNMHVPFYVGAVALVIGLAILTTGRKLLRTAEEAQAADAVATNAPAVSGSAATSPAESEPVETEPAEARSANPAALPDRIPVTGTGVTATFDAGFSGELVAAVDGTETATRVVDKAARIAHDGGMRVHVIHVLEAVVAADTALPGEDLESATSRIREHLDRLAGQGVPAVGHVLLAASDHGAAGRAIAEYANGIHARSLVIGAPTHGGLAALMDASASSEIWRAARTDVTIVNPQAAPTRTA